MRGAAAGSVRVHRKRRVKQTLGYMKQCGAEEGHLVVIDRRSEGAKDCRDGGGEAGGGGRRQDGRRVVIWML